MYIVSRPLDFIIVVRLVAVKSLLSAQPSLWLYPDVLQRTDDDRIKTSVLRAPENASWINRSCRFGARRDGLLICLTKVYSSKLKYIISISQLKFERKLLLIWRFITPVFRKLELPDIFEHHLNVWSDPTAPL